MAISPKEKTTLHKKFARQKTMQTDGLGIRLYTYIPLKIKIKMGEWDSILHSIHAHYSQKNKMYFLKNLKARAWIIQEIQQGCKVGTISQP